MFFMGTLVINENSAHKGSVTIAMSENKASKPVIVDNQFVAKIESGLLEIKTIDCKRFALRGINVLRVSAGSDDDAVIYEGTFDEVIFS